ncbi:MAG: hypothetical protein JWN67_855 [Actinomycetia bacterium]|nr:hypothetical protein [Actinomycetes bacterium]
MTVVLDDQVLSAELRGRHLFDDERRYTTGLWYVRLCQAVWRAQGGALSAPFADLPAPVGARALASVLALPDHIGLLSLRELGPAMGELAGRHQLNALARETLAVALVLEATLVLSDRNVSPRLLAAAEVEGVAVSVVAVS